MCPHSRQEVWLSTAAGVDQGPGEREGGGGGELPGEQAHGLREEGGGREGGHQAGGAGRREAGRRLPTPRRPVCRPRGDWEHHAGGGLGGS